MLTAYTTNVVRKKQYGKMSRILCTTNPISGHIVMAEAIAIVPKKIKAIMDWPLLKMQDNCSFGADYYKRFVKNFSKIAYPITSLQQKGRKFLWPEGCEKAFAMLKKKFNTMPILKLPNPEVILGPTWVSGPPLCSTCVLKLNVGSCMHAWSRRHAQGMCGCHGSTWGSRSLPRAGACMQRHHPSIYILHGPWDSHNHDQDLQM